MADRKDNNLTYEVPIDDMPQTLAKRRQAEYQTCITPEVTINQ